MSLLGAIKAAFKTEPVHTAPRYYAATKEESALARSRKASIVAQLAVYNACTTHEQRVRETEEEIARRRAKALAEGKGVRR